MASSPRVPQELLDKIIDNLHNDYESLKQCSLASTLVKMRSHKYLYSTIRLHTTVRIQHLRNLVDVNSRLLENVRKLELEPCWAWIKEDTDFPLILRRTTSLRSLIILGAHSSWSSIHRNTRDALIQVFRSPSLINLSIREMQSFPIPIFALDINVMHLELTGITLVDFIDDCPGATSMDYSRMTVPTLEILLRTPSRFNALIDLPHSFVSRIKHLIIYDTGRTVALANRIMTTTMNSLESLQIRIISTAHPTSWFECDFTLLHRLNHIEFYVKLGHRATENFRLLASTALRSIIDFFTKNPTAARIRRFSICFIRFWGTGPMPDWRPYLDDLAAIGSWHEVDRILDAARGSTSMLAKFILSLDLGLTEQDSQRYFSDHPDDLKWRRSIDEMQIAWQEKVHTIMPLASRWGVLVARNILDMET